METFMEMECESKNHPILNNFFVLLYQIASFFFWGVSLFYAYEWISWNFNLPPMTYFEMVSMFTAANVICRTIRKVFRPD